LTNQQSGAAFNAITNTIKDSYLDIDSEDYVTIYSNRIKANEESADKVTDEVGYCQKTKKDKVKVDLASITGTYQDKMVWDVVISEKKKFF
jgi:hypothetical protein